MKGIRISKEGSTVNDGIDNQYVDTEQPLFKLFDSQQKSVVFTGQTYSAGSPFVIPIPHNLGYWPMNFVYMDRASNASRKLVTNVDTAFPENTILAIVTFDNKNIYINITGNAITGTFGYNYQIYYDKVGSDG
jgi:hypothetical protein